MKTDKASGSLELSQYSPLLPGPLNSEKLHVTPELEAKLSKQIDLHREKIAVNSQIQALRAGRITRLGSNIDPDQIAAMEEGRIGFGRLDEQDPWLLSNSCTAIAVRSSLIAMGVGALAFGVYVTAKV